MLTASLSLFILAVLVPNLILLAGRRHPGLQGQLPNLSFAFILASFVLGVAHLLDAAANWSLGLIVYLAFEAACLVSTILLLPMKEAHKTRMLGEALAGRAESASDMRAGSAVEIGEKAPGNCVPSILGDTKTADVDTGWTVSSLFSWHVYVYRLRVSATVQPEQVTVSAEAETYDANWVELYLAGIGLLVPGAQLLTLIAGASIKHAYYNAKQTATGLATCVPMEGACVLIPTADPAVAGARHNPVAAAALVTGTRMTNSIVQFQLSGVASMTGHNTVGGITVTATAGASTPVPGPLTGASGGPVSIQLSGGINVGISLVPSPTAVQNQTFARAVTIQCKPETPAS